MPVWVELILVIWIELSLAAACAGGHTAKLAGASATTDLVPPTGAGTTPATVFTPTAPSGIAPALWTLQKLPGTGQVTDYTPTFGEDADYTLNPPAYADDGDGTVTDRVTGLMWQQRDGGEMTFADAAIYCQSLDLGGRHDWRLPSTLELFSLGDFDRNPALNPAYFPDSQAQYWWTGEQLAGDASKVWVVNAGGGIGAHPMNETISAGGRRRFAARCVRGAQVGLPVDFTANGDGTVTDHNAGLMWQQGEATPDVTWEAALNYCESLSLAGHHDWRLPNIKQLRIISDDRRVRPSIDTTLFPGARPVRYWSSTTLYGHVNSAWFVDFLTGLASYNDKAGQLAMRCVRTNSFK